MTWISGVGSRLRSPWVIAGGADDRRRRSPAGVVFGAKFAEQY